MFGALVGRSGRRQRSRPERSSASLLLTVEIECVADLVADPRLQSTDLSHRPPYLLAHLGQPVRAEDEECDDEDDQDLRGA